MVLRFLLKLFETSSFRAHLVCFGFCSTKQEVRKLSYRIAMRPVVCFTSYNIYTLSLYSQGSFIYSIYSIYRLDYEREISKRK